jgi:hypothetical protein
MPCHASINAFVLSTAMLMTVTGAQAFDDSKYPDLSGQWKRPPGVSNQYDTSKPRTAEEAPLTPEYQKIFEANLNVIFPMEIVVTPKTTYIMIEYLSMLRRIYTDGRDWPTESEPSFMGYSIGKWTDADASGRFNTLEVETRLLKGPRAYDFNGIPLHSDNETVVKERIYLDKANTNILHDEITTFDHALTHPWKIVKNYVRELRPIVWFESICAESNEHIRIGKDNYMMSADGYLMPAKKGQRPPDLRYFKESQK